MSGSSAAIRVLHVDDDPDILGVTAEMLEREDERFEVLTATGAREGLDLLATEDVDCVVSDHDMAGRNGIEFLGSVRENHGSLPFILFTGKGSEEVASEAISAGVDDYLQKELGTDQYAVLANRIANLVEQHHVESQLERSQRELAERTQTLSAVHRASPLPIVVIDPDGTVRLWNEAAERVFGWSRREVLGEGIPVVPEAKRDEYDRYRERVLAGESFTDVKVERRTKEGAVLDLSLSTAPIRDADGQVSGVVALYAEVSDREQTLEQLHEVTRNLLRAETKADVAEQTVRAVSEVLGYGNNCVRLLSDDGTELRAVASASEAGTSVGGRRYAPGEGTVGRTFATGETQLYDDVRELDDGYDRADLRSSMYVAIGDHGTLSIGDTTVGAFDDSDRHLAEIFAANAETAMDLVEQTRQLQSQNDRLESFAGIVSHDLRNPLNVVAGSLQLARETGDEEYFERCDRALDRMEELIDELLDVARYSDDVAEAESVDLSAAVDRAWSHVHTDGASLRNRTEATVRADANSLQQLLENLFRNAVEHGSTSAQSMTASEDAVRQRSAGADPTARRGDAEQGSTDSPPSSSPEDLTITVGDLEDGFYVEDDGPGIPADRREQIFEHGYSTSTVGTGIGLAIVEQTAHAQSWDVAVTDGADGGARFEFTWGAES